ncbi:MAG: CdaR family protein [Bacteroidales bacterium]|nr:CdaR family protein [Bacteroidales bacterium]
MDQEESSGEDIKSILSLLKAKLLNRNVGIFSFFLLLSFIFWYINALSKNISGKVDFPVRYINFPENLALVNELPDQLSLELEGPGYSVLRARISGNKTPLVIDVDNSGLSVKNNEAELEFFIRSNSLRETFLKQIRSDFEINSVQPDSIDFIFDKIKVKKVKVIPDVKINLQKQFMINGKITANPDSVEISGPATIVDTIRSVKTEFHEFNHVNEKIMRNMELLPLRKVGISHKRAEITIPVEQYTEEVIDLEIRIINMPDTAEVRLFPDMVSVQFNIALSDYNKIQEIPLGAVVDLKNLDVRKVERLDVELLNQPAFISNVRYNPRQVEYIIEKK